MKTLVFDTKEKYEFIYMAMSMSEIGYRGVQLRHINRIFDKLESIGKSNGERYVLDFSFPKSLDDAFGTTYPLITLEDPEFELLITTYDSIPWTPNGARLAATVYEWIHSLK